MIANSAEIIKMVKATFLDKGVTLESFFCTRPSRIRRFTVMAVI